MDRFYKYIRRRENGRYQIIKDGESWGDYSDVRDALYDRDQLIECGWDMGELCAKDYPPNKYLDMELPNFENDFCYITAKDNGGVKQYIIQKRFGKKVRQFGVFDNIEDAIRRRDELIERGWKNES